MSIKVMIKSHTNKVERLNNKIVITKKNNGFNHKIDYSILNKFEFVPKLISNDMNKTIWEYIDGKTLANPTNKVLIEIANNLRTIHKSNLNFPKNNLRKRVHKYLQIIHDKYIREPAIENNYIEMTKLLKRMIMQNPSHNDLWSQNIILDKKNKIWFIDWEYATMGDKHFDLAYFIEEQELTKEQEKIFLDAYNSHDDYQAWIPDWLPKYKKFVNWITLLWAYAQDELPFDVSKLKEKLK